ncbi:hypothetical protein MMC34_006906 [Xylographa carneopallida]|nr:hypothetical protein [Xylographa carneopallida]
MDISIITNPPCHAAPSRTREPDPVLHTDNAIPLTTPTPAPSSPSDAPNPPSPPHQPHASSSPSPPPKRRLTTPNACTTCKRAKAKCSGAHPTCTRCARRGEGPACRYEADTRSQKEAMVEEIRELRRRYSRAERILQAVGTDEGGDTVRALKRGESYEEIERGLGGKV